MIKKSSVVDFAFLKSTGIDINKAFAVLAKKGITSEEMSDAGKKLVEGIRDYTQKKDIDDNYLVLYHLVLSYLVFKTAVMSYEEWIAEAAKEHNMKPDKYAKIMYNPG